MCNFHTVCMILVGFFYTGSLKFLKFIVNYWEGSKENVWQNFAKCLVYDILNV